MSTRPTKDFHISIFYKDGKPCMLIEAKVIEKLEALHGKILEWLQ